MPLIEDWRVPSRHAYVVSKGVELVKIPDEIRKCVAFVAYLTPSGDEHLAGTAFLVAEPIEGVEDRNFTWAVTAAHVINGIRAKSIDGQVRLRMNTREGPEGTVWYAMSVDDWESHTTDDVAVAPINLNLGKFDHLTWPLHDQNVLLNEARIVEEGIGVGDDLFFPGLFVHHPGFERNVPIVRVGNIAAMPGEPLHVSYWGRMKAYLVETRSIGGLSGAPVYVHLGFVKVDGDNLQYFRGAKHGRFLLLGVMSGHYEGGLTEADVSLAPAPREPKDEEREINMGIGIVVPIQRLMEVITRPELDERKAKVREELLAENHGKAVADQADVPIPAKDAEPTFESREEFEIALRKVSRRKLSQPDEGTSGTSE